MSTESLIGSIAMFAGNFAPRGYALCAGQLLSIAQNTALFSILGTTYGGDGRVTFALPDLRGRVPIHVGQGPGLSNYDLGETGGTETVTLTVNQMPSHAHVVTPKCGASVPQSPLYDPTNNYSTGTDSATPGVGIYTSTPDAVMGASPTTAAGGNQPCQILQPFLVLTF